MAIKISTPSIISIVGGVFSLALEAIDAYATPEDLAADVSSGVSTVLGTLGSIATGGMANTVAAVSAAESALSPALSALISSLAALIHPAAKAAAASTPAA